eukprot:3630894-Amphidinium_carterae.5
MPGDDGTDSLLFGEGRVRHLLVQKLRAGPYAEQEKDAELILTVDLPQHRLVKSWRLVHIKAVICEWEATQCVDVVPGFVLTLLPMRFGAAKVLRFGSEVLHAEEKSTEPKAEVSSPPRVKSRGSGAKGRQMGYRTKKLQCMPDCYVDALLFDVMEGSGSQFMDFFRRGIRHCKLLDRVEVWARSSRLVYQG